MLALKFPSLLYTAVMECVAVESVEIETPPVALVSAAEPIEVAPSKNSTEPVGVPAPGAVALTVAVNVTDCPCTEGFISETTAVVVAALFTV